MNRAGKSTNTIIPLVPASSFTSTASYFCSPAQCSACMLSNPGVMEIQPSYPRYECRWMGPVAERANEEVTKAVEASPPATDDLIDILLRT